MAAQWWKRIFLGNAMDVELDGTGRVLVSPELRAAAGIEKETMLLGMGNHFELWDKSTYEAKEAEAMHGRDARRLQGLLFLSAGGGQHMATHHRLVERSSRRPSRFTKPDATYVDATFGRGGHSRLILSRLGPQGAPDRLRQGPGGDRGGNAIDGPALFDPPPGLRRDRRAAGRQRAPAC